MLQGNRLLANQHFAYIFAVQPYIHTFVDDRARRLLSPLRLGERCAKVGDLAGLSAPSACNILQPRPLLRDKHGIQSAGGPAIISYHHTKNRTQHCHVLRRHLWLARMVSINDVDACVGSRKKLRSLQRHRHNNAHAAAATERLPCQFTVRSGIVSRPRCGF